MRRNCEAVNAGVRRLISPPQRLIAADPVSWACLKDRISKTRKQPLILHAENGNAMRAATLESRPAELGVLRSFSIPRVCIDNMYSQSLFRVVWTKSRGAGSIGLITPENHLPSKPILSVGGRVCRLVHPPTPP